jgi:hypothetical protein
LGPIVVAVALSGCSRAPRISDTGYVGTWARGTERSRSTIAIVKDGNEYRFRWTAATDDGTWKVTCGWDGNCKEFAKDQQVASYVIEIRLDPETSRLRVKNTRIGTPKSPENNMDVDELVVEKGGKVLRSYVIQRNDQHFEPGKGSTRYFDKVSDEVDDPPPASRN